MPAIALVLCGVLAAAAVPLSSALLGSSSHAGLLRVGLAAVPLASFGTITINWLRFQRRPMVTVIFALTMAATTLCATLYFLNEMHLGLTAVPLGQVVGSAVGATLAFLMLPRWFNPRLVNLARLRQMLRFGLPLMPATVAIWVVNLLDRYFLESFHGAHQVGLYQAANQLAAVVAIATTAFQLAWGPFAFAHAADTDAKRIYSRVMLLFTVAASALCAVVASLAPQILSLAATPAYARGAQAVPWLTFSFVSVGLMYIAAVGPSIVGRTGLIAQATLLGAGLTIVLDLILVPPYAATGAAIATFTAWSAVPVYLFFRAHACFPVSFPTPAL